MSILIKGIKMPKDEPLLVKINPDGTVSTTASNNYKKYEAVELSPHGRLIDENVLRKAIEDYVEESFMPKIWVDGTASAVNFILDTPTVIEAEADG